MPTRLDVLKAAVSAAQLKARGATLLQHPTTPDDAVIGEMSRA